MFKLELDMSLYFIPPMTEIGRGIRLTRAFELPFAPTKGLRLTCEALNGFPHPMGFSLKDITWDSDRGVFLADTSLYEHDFPLACLADEIRSWLDRGWKLGSYADNYPEQGDDEPALDEAPAEVVETAADDTDDNEWLTRPSRSRPKHLNKLLRALVRAMVELHNNLSVAYALDQTKMYFDKEQLKGDKTPAMKRFDDACHAFYKMSDDEQWAWRDRVLRTHPRLDRIVREA